METQPENTDAPPNFPSYPKPQGIPLLSHPKQQSPLLKLAQRMMTKPKLKLPTKTFSKSRKHKVKFY